MIVVRQQNWRLVFNRDCGDNGDHGAELYDLDTDVGETTNLAAQHPEVVGALMAKGLRWQEDFPGPLWGQRRGVRKAADEEQ